jgi:hypothetical protein
VVGEDSILAFRDEPGIGGAWLFSPEDLSWQPTGPREDPRYPASTFTDLQHIFARPDGGFLGFAERTTYAEYQQPYAIWLTTDSGDWVYQQLDPTVWGHATVLLAGWLGDAAVVIGQDLATGEALAWRGEPVTQRQIAPWTPSVQMPAPAPPPHRERVGRCPALPANVDELLAVGTATAVRCFGSQEITVDGWLDLYRGCAWDGGLLDAQQRCGLISSNGGDGQPDANALPVRWLSQYSNWHLRGTREAVYGPDIAVYFDPGHTRHPTRGGHFTVTGHFDDPMAATCDDFVPGAYPRFDPPKAYVNSCRQRFVVTSRVRVH